MELSFTFFSLNVNIYFGTVVELFSFFGVFAVHFDKRLHEF